MNSWPVETALAMNDLTMHSMHVTHQSQIFNGMAIVIIPGRVCISMIVRSTVVCDSAHEQFCHNKYIQGRMVF